MLRIDDYSESIGREFQEFAVKHTIQLKYGDSKADLPKADATGILVEVGMNKYLISASHVFGGGKTSDICYLLDNGHYTTLGGTMVMTKNNESELNDKIDLAILRVDTETITNLNESGYKFYSLDNINPDTIYKEKDLLHLYGFPASRTKTNLRKKIVKYMPWSYMTSIMDVNIRGYDKRLHIFMSYKRKRMARKAVKGHLKGPKPKGMSGCGIWYCTDLLKESGKLNFILAGIMTEYIKERSLLVGVRINAITEILRTMFSEDFHVSRTVKFK